LPARPAAASGTAGQCARSRRDGSGCLPAADTLPAVPNGLIPTHLLLTTVVFTAPAVAQDSPATPSPDAPEPTEPFRTTPDEQAPAFLPEEEPEAEPPRPGLTGGIDWLAELAEDAIERIEPTLLPERTFLSGRVGTVIPGPRDTVIFVSAETERQPGERAMLLLPTDMTRSIGSMLRGANSAAVVISGEVLVYRDRNYLLPSGFRTPKEPAEEDAGAADGAQPDDGEAGEEPEPREPGAAAIDPEADVESLVEQLREIGTRDAGPSPAPWVRPGSELDEDDAEEEDAGFAARGTRLVMDRFLSQRRGRIQRMPSGALAFVIGNDADLAEREAGPLVLLPSRMLERIEEVSLRGGDLQSVILSGRITTAGERRYLLPTLFRLPPPEDVDPMQ